MTGLSRSQIDRLGERLRAGPPTEEDLVALDEYRRSFGETQEALLRLIRSKGLEPTGRPAKSTGAILAKLRRESGMKLSQIQDIAGCRIKARDILDQDRIVESLREGAFPEAKIRDRRDKPSHGYRAVHVILNFGGQRVEVQVRTLVQHQWALFSERCSDAIDPGLKYGAGPERIRELLAATSVEVANFEQSERGLVDEEAATVQRLAEQAARVEIFEPFYKHLLAENAAKFEEAKSALEEARAAYEQAEAAFEDAKSAFEESEEDKDKIGQERDSLAQHSASMRGYFVRRRDVREPLRNLLLKRLNRLQSLLDTPEDDGIRRLGLLSDILRRRETKQE